MTAQVAIERLGNLGYGALKKEATPGTPVTPNIFFPLYKASINTDLKLDKDNPIMGVRSNPFNVFMGQREHTGQLEVLAEANTAEYWFDMMLTQGAITGGSDPYTHPFTEGLANSYTLDLLKGQLVERYWGVQAESIECSFDKNKGKFSVDISARGSLISRKIATVSGTTITLDTTYDPAPNKGFVVSDVVRVLKADNSNVLDTTIGTVNADGITLILGATAAAFAQGDLIFLRAQTPSYSIDTYPFEWARTEFRFGANASAALTATALAEEKGAKWKISHKFEKKGGSDRSGSYDPANLVRLQTEAEVTLKTFFDQPTQDLERFLDVSNQALVIRMFAGSAHELRLTFDQMQYETHKREFDSAKIIYADIKGTPVYNTSNTEAFNVKVLNAVST